MSEVKTSFLDETAGDGQDRISYADKPKAFVRILAQLSPACTEGSDGYVEGAKPGMLLNYATGKLYGKSIKVVPLYHDVIWTEWKPDRGGYVASHKPGSVPVDKTDFKKWVLPNGNIITEYYMFYCFLPDYPEDGIVIFDLSSTAIKHAQKWLTHISNVKTETGKKAATYTSVWNLEVMKDTDGKNIWYQFGTKKGQTGITWDRFITEEEYLTFVKPQREEIISRIDTGPMLLENKSEQSAQKLLGY